MQKNITFLLCLGFVAITGCGLFLYILSSVTEIETTSSIGELSDIFLSLTSVLMTIGLGWIVYNQTERINKLEIAQHDIYLGIERVEFNETFDTEFKTIDIPTQNNTHKVKLFKALLNETPTIVAHIHMEDRQGILFIPFVFITKNSPLITSLRLKEIGITLVPSLECQPAKTETIPLNADPVYNVLPDESNFIITLGIHGIKQCDLSIIKVSFLIEVEDQLNRNHVFECNAELMQMHTNLRLSSSRTKLSDKRL